MRGLGFYLLGVTLAAIIEIIFFPFESNEMLLSICLASLLGLSVYFILKKEAK